MTAIEKMNNAAREYNNNNASHPVYGNAFRGSNPYWLNHYNNQTYKQSNGQYSEYYSKRYY